MNTYVLTYTDRRLVTRSQIVRVDARNTEHAVALGNQTLERRGYRLRSYRRPTVRMQA